MILVMAGGGFAVEQGWETAPNCKNKGDPQRLSIKKRGTTGTQGCRPGIFLGFLTGFDEPLRKKASEPVSFDVADRASDSRQEYCGPSGFQPQLLLDAWRR